MVRWKKRVHPQQLLWHPQAFLDVRSSSMIEGVNTVKSILELIFVEQSRTECCWNWWRMSNTGRWVKDGMRTPNASLITLCWLLSEANHSSTVKWIFFILLPCNATRTIGPQYLPNPARSLIPVNHHLDPLLGPDTLIDALRVLVEAIRNITKARASPSFNRNSTISRNILHKLRVHSDRDLFDPINAKEQHLE